MLRNIISLNIFRQQIMRMFLDMVANLFHHIPSLPHCSVDDCGHHSYGHIANLHERPRLLIMILETLQCGKHVPNQKTGPTYKIRKPRIEGLETLTRKD